MKNIIKWLVTGEVGLSSKCMASVACGYSTEDYNYPRDPADLNRCIKLVDDAPEIRNSFSKIADLCPEWKVIIDNWDELVKTFVGEVGYDWCRDKKAPITYKMMRDLLDGVRK